MNTETETGEWTTEYDNRFAFKRQRGSDTIKVKKPQDIEGARDTYEVIGRLAGDIYHTTHAHENGAIGRVMVLEELADHEVTFEEGDEVFVIDEAFETIIQSGHISYNPDKYKSLPVLMPTDPYHEDVEEGRIIHVQEEQVLHAEAGAVEFLSFIGRDDLLEVEDFE